MLLCKQRLLVITIIEEDKVTTKVKRRSLLPRAKLKDNVSRLPSN